MANTKISDLSAASTLAGTEPLAIVQGVATVKATATQIANLVRTEAATAELIRDVIGATLVAGSGVTITPDDSPNIITITASGGSPITSSSAQAFAVGQNGNTNPSFNVDASTASSATGWSAKSLAAGAGATLTVLSSAADESGTIAAKGSTSTLNLNGGNRTHLQSGTAQFSAAGATFQYSFRGFTANPAYSFTGVADSNLTASTECMSFDLNFAQVKTHATGALTTQRDIRFRPSTHAFAGASTLTDAYGAYIDGAPIAGTNATITNSYTLGLGGNAVGAGVTNSYALVVNPNTGATNNWGAYFFGRTRFDATNTAGGTTGAQTINKPSGTVNFAAAATSLVVTNSLCTTSSIVFATVRTNDTTALIKNVVPSAGSFTINLNAAATAETSVGFLIIN